MSRRRLLPLLVPRAIGTLAIALLGQASRATTSNSAGNPNILTNDAIIEMAAAKLPEELILTKIRTSKTNSELSTPARVELAKGGVSANVVKAMMTPKNAAP